MFLRLPASFALLFLWALAGPIALLAEPLTFTEVARKEVRLGDHTVTLIRVRPPSLPKTPAATIPPPRTPTAEEKAYEERVARKGYALLQVSATVYFGGKTPVTELRWRNDAGDIEYLAYSNIDFRYLTQLTQIETETTVYAWFPFVYDCDLAELPSDQKPRFLAGLDFSATQAEYFIEARDRDLSGQQATLAGLDYLHAYYQLHYAELKADFEKREVLAAAAEKHRREHPPKTPDATLYFWPIKSRLHPR